MVTKKGTDNSTSSIKGMPLPRFELGFISRWGSITFTKITIEANQGEINLEGPNSHYLGGLL